MILLTNIFYYKKNKESSVNGNLSNEQKDKILDIVSKSIVDKLTQSIKNSELSIGDSIKINYTCDLK